MNDEIEFKEQLNKIKDNLVIGISKWWGFRHAGYRGIIVNDKKELYEYQYYHIAPKELQKSNYNYIIKVKDLTKKEYNKIINFINKEIKDKQFTDEKIFDMGYTVSINYNGIKKEIINNKSYDKKLKIYDKTEKLLQGLLKRSLMALISDKIIRIKFRISEKSVNKQLKDYTTEKSIYKLPKILKFPRRIETKIYGDMQVFEMKPAKGIDKKIMFIHGGGYIQTFSFFHWLFLIKICKKTGCGLTVPNYPLLPKYTYEESYKKVIEYYNEYVKNNDDENLILVGDSAGGGFCLSLLQQLKEKNLPLPKKTILISPFVDVTGANEKMNKKDALVDYKATIILGKAWANGADLKSWKISPLYGNLKNLPPTEIYVGNLEVLCDECIELYNKLKSSGNDVKLYIGESMGHDYPIWPIPEADQAINNMIKFINER